MRIYTRRGDSGETGLIGGQRVPKDHPRVEAYGTVDELNSYLGLLRSSLQQDDLDQALEKVQNLLFEIGSELACPPERTAAFTSVRPEHVSQLEQLIDRLESELPPLQHFILPGGSPAAALAHIARAVCRRAERRVVTLRHEPSLNPDIIRYLNRLGDLLFVIARVINSRAGVPETVWRSEITPKRKKEE